MEHKNTTRNYGIWLDKKMAHIVQCQVNGEKLKTVYSELEFYNPRGGSRSKTRWGPQQVGIHDSRYTEREKHQLKAYFEKVIKNIQNADAVALYGPGDTYKKLHKELTKHPELKDKVVEVSNADSMSLNQFKAKVRDFYTPGKVKSQ